MIELINLTGRGDGIGGVLALGASAAATRFGAPHLAMSVQGISIQNVDPRPAPAWGLLNATENSGGAAHGGPTGTWSTTCSTPVLPPRRRAKHPEGDRRAVRYRQDLVAVIDSLTSCAFGSYACTVQDYADALSLVTDEPVTTAALLATGARSFTAERSCNIAHAFTAADDTLPPRFTSEPVPDGIHAGRACSLEPSLDEYFAGRGWNRARARAHGGGRHRSRVAARRTGRPCGLADHAPMTIPVAERSTTERCARRYFGMSAFERASQRASPGAGRRTNEARSQAWSRRNTVDEPPEFTRRPVERGAHIRRLENAPRAGIEKTATGGGLMSRRPDRKVPALCRCRAFSRRLGASHGRLRS